MVFSLVFLMGGAWCLPALSQTTLELKIREIITQRHPTDTAETWQSLGEGAPQAMIAMYEKTPRVYERLRLLQGLGWFDDPDAVAFLKDQARQQDNSVFRRAAVDAVGRSQGVRESDFVKGFLDHPDPQTRLAAAQALQRMIRSSPGVDSSALESRLQSFRASEKTKWVVQRLDREFPVGSKTFEKNQRFAGTWDGVRLSAGKGAEVKIERAQAVWAVDAQGRLSGQVTVEIGANPDGSASKPEVWKLDQAKINDAFVSGQWISTGSRAGGELRKFDAALKRDSDTDVLHLQFDGRGDMIYLRRTVSSR